MTFQELTYCKSARNSKKIFFVRNTKRSSNSGRFALCVKVNLESHLFSGIQPVLPTLFATLCTYFALRPFRKSLRTLRTCPELSPTVSDNFEFSVFIRILAHFRVLTTQSCHFLWCYMATLPLQNSRDRLQVVGIQSLTHRSTRQDKYFSATSN